MKKQIIKYLFLFVFFASIGNVAIAQKGKKKAPAKRTSVKRSTKNKTKTNIQNANASVDTPAKVDDPLESDSLPIKKVKKSMRPDESVSGGDAIRERTPLPYEDLRMDDAVYRHKIWREIDAREKINLPFRYSADENSGNQRFISILLQAIQDDSTLLVFNSIDDRFTTPMSKSEISKAVAGDIIEVPQFDSLGNPLPSIRKRNEVNLDSFYRFRVKEEVVFDKESSRLFFRILGIAPVKDVITSAGVNLGPTELFWIYYPDFRPVFAKNDVYNGKNFGARMSWEELFESRMFYGRIIKSTIDNPYDQFIKNYKGLSENTILQLLEGESIKEKIFNYEQDLWSY